MILPIIAYGAPILRTHCEAISPGHPGLEQLLVNMWHTLDNAGGAGLAAPQVNVPWQLFIVDSSQQQNGLTIRQAFLNAVITQYGVEENWEDEGCLSIPGIWEKVPRSARITIRYQDTSFNWQEDIFTGHTARIIQHEYDHINGRLYLDLLPSLRRNLLSGKLRNITRGRFKQHYPMRLQ
ncbi:peptide deformylase [Chitinophaga pendula]|uniref:peptide deformylase n=1 Tax=Chitinophaga TaxID=79328 RepID=UPI000BB0A42C|nr:MULTISPECIES: peptide deformylase [Chitinophaga]ASZ10523.1 peptide deformylase [Chitinophaga sp. MD30]UCJ06504.1 peptide deformylase [Chitinophaga pendula]